LEFSRLVIAAAGIHPVLLPNSIGASAGRRGSDAGRAGPSSFLLEEELTDPRAEKVGVCLSILSGRVGLVPESMWYCTPTQRLRRKSTFPRWRTRKSADSPVSLWWHGSHAGSVARRTSSITRTGGNPRPTSWARDCGHVG
jgi:hypothetical protein